MLINLTIPVFNEEARLASCMARRQELHVGHSELGGLDCEMVIASNGSTDRTLEIARQLAREHRRLHVLDLPQKGRGGALKRAWLQSPADVLSYMDVDLSADLAAFPKLVEAVADGGFDLAIGSRLLPGSQTVRGWKRELISRSYNRLVQALLSTGLSDLQCGFKAIRRAAAQALLPLVEDTGWLFDTELLILADRLGYRIRELPVRWVEDADSRVKLWCTALGDLKGLMRLRRSLAKGHSVAMSSGRRA
jgi:glycosyltransferase involved in cell wall biosynthesis